MRFVFLHQNFPGQFPHVAKALAEQGHACVAVTQSTNTAPPIIQIEPYEFNEARSR